MSPPSRGLGRDARAGEVAQSSDCKEKLGLQTNKTKEGVISWTAHKDC